MKYIAPEMEMRALEVEDIIMSNNQPEQPGDGTVVTPDEEL